MTIQQLDDRDGLTQPGGCPQCLIVLERVDQPDPPGVVVDNGVRGAFHRARVDPCDPVRMMLECCAYTLILAHRNPTSSEPTTYKSTARPLFPVGTKPGKGANIGAGAIGAGTDSERVQAAAIGGFSALKGLVLNGAVLTFAGLYIYFIVRISGASRYPQIDGTLVTTAAALAGVLGLCIRPGDQHAD